MLRRLPPFRGSLPVVYLGQDLLHGSLRRGTDGAKRLLIAAFGRQREQRAAFKSVSVPFHGQIDSAESLDLLLQSGQAVRVVGPSRRLQVLRRADIHPGMSLLVLK